MPFKVTEKRRDVESEASRDAGQMGTEDVAAAGRLREWDYVGAKGDCR